MEESKNADFYQKSLLPLTWKVFTKQREKLLLAMIMRIPVGYSVLRSGGDILFALAMIVLSMSDLTFFGGQGRSITDPSVLWRSFVVAVFTLIAAVVIALISAPITTLVARLTKAIQEGKELSIKGLFSEMGSKKLWITMVTTRVGQVIRAFAWGLLFIFPGIWQIIQTLFAIIIVSLRGYSTSEALEESKNIVRGRTGKMLGHLALIGAVNILLAILIGIFFLSLEGILQFLLGLGKDVQEVYIIGSEIKWVSILSVTVIFSTIYLTLLYLKWSPEASISLDSSQPKNQEKVNL